MTTERKWLTAGAIYVSAATALYLIGAWGPYEQAYYAAYTITSPTWPAAIYPVLMVSHIASDITGGDFEGNSFGLAVTLWGFVAAASVNFLLVRLLVQGACALVRRLPGVGASH